MVLKAEPKMPVNCTRKLNLLLPFLRRETENPKPRPLAKGAHAMIIQMIQPKMPKTPS